MNEQLVNEDAIIVPDLDDDDRERIKAEVREAAKKEQPASSGNVCIMCGKEATHCMRGLPSNTYCKECALEHFKFLNYLERL